MSLINNITVVAIIIAIHNLDFQINKEEVVLWKNRSKNKTQGIVWTMMELYPLEKKKLSFLKEKKISSNLYQKVVIIINKIQLLILLRN